SIPASATSLTFDDRVLQGGGGRWITVYFNDTRLLTFDEDSFVGDGFTHEVIPLALVAGESGVLSISINGTGSQPTELALANFGFIDEAPPVPTIGFESDPTQSITVSFNEQVTGLSADALQVTNVTTGQTFPVLAVSSDDDGKSARF